MVSLVDPTGAAGKTYCAQVGEAIAGAQKVPITPPTCKLGALKTLRHTLLPVVSPGPEQAPGGQVYKGPAWMAATTVELQSPEALPTTTPELVGEISSVPMLTEYDAKGYPFENVLETFP